MTRYVLVGVFCAAILSGCASSSIGSYNWQKPHVQLDGAEAANVLKMANREKPNFTLTYDPGVVAVPRGILDSTLGLQRKPITLAFMENHSSTSELSQRRMTVMMKELDQRNISVVMGPGLVGPKTATRIWFISGDAEEAIRDKFHTVLR